MLAFNQERARRQAIIVYGLNGLPHRQPDYRLDPNYRNYMRVKLRDRINALDVEFARIKYGYSGHASFAASGKFSFWIIHNNNHHHCRS